jgi:6-pyruvoyltetrahydropterin/6-carboxytetrahydropterin synthase
MNEIHLAVPQTRQANGAAPAARFELSQSFYFEAAHSLNRTIDTESSRRIHGHTYIARVTVAARRDPVTGMVVDLGTIQASIRRVRSLLDHTLLDTVPDLGPATLENLCLFIWRNIAPDLQDVSSVRVGRKATGDACVVRIPERKRVAATFLRVDDPQGAQQGALAQEHTLEESAA